MDASGSISFKKIEVEQIQTWYEEDEDDLKNKVS